MQVSAIVPVYGSAGSLPRLVEELAAVLTDATTDHEIVLVDDGSVDGSWGAIVQLTDLYPQVVGIRLARNVGEHNALLCGIRAARFAVAVTLDDDLQNPPSEIPLLLDGLAEGHDLVYGVPARVHQSRSRRVAAWIWKWVASVLLRTADVRAVSSFRAFRTSLRDAFADGPSQAIFLDEMLHWGATSTSFVKVRHAPRAIGRSNYQLSGLIEHTLDMITNYSVRPLRLASAAGALLATASVCFVLAGAVTRADGNLAMWLLAALVTLVGGSVLLALGIIGEYLGRVFERSTHQPPYVVASVRAPTDHHRARTGTNGELGPSELAGERDRPQVPGARS